MRILLLLIVLANCQIECYAQTKITSRTFAAKILDASSKDPLTYATVFNKTQKRGTASSENGSFELPKTNIGDSLLVSFIGYADQLFIFQKDTPGIILLETQAANLEEIVVRSESDYLYDLLSKLRKCKRANRQNAKTYFFLESKQKGKIVEMIESYFQGVYTNCSLQKLDIKKGRIGLKAVDERFYLSTETSRVFSMHDIFSHSSMFPSNPLCYRKKHMKSTYKLRLQSSYDLNGSKIFVVQFWPKEAAELDSEKNLFSGTLWFNKEKNQILKIKLKKDRSKKYPFKPIGPNTISEVSLEITKTFQEIGKEAVMNAIDFNYTIYYRDQNKIPYEAYTKAYLKAYDFDKSFNLPYFEFTDLLHEDYRNMTIVPYDSLFWSSSAEFRIFEHETKIETFLDENHLQNEFIIPDTTASKSCLQYHYVNWSKKRLDIRQSEKESLTLDNFRNGNTFNEDLYNFNCKIYLDVNDFDSKINLQLYSIMDPVNSYFKTVVNNEERAFVNMYFDLLEIEKRKLAERIKKTPDQSIQKIEALYMQSQEAFEQRARRFASDTIRGQRITGMKKWNAIIADELGIDNLAIFMD